MSSSRPWNMVWPIFCINSLSLLCICDKSRLIERNFHNMFLFFLFQSDDQRSKKGAEQFDAKWFRQSILRCEEKFSAWSQLLKSGSVRSMRRTLLAPLLIALAIQTTDRWAFCCLDRWQKKPGFLRNFGYQFPVTVLQFVNVGTVLFVWTSGHSS